MRAPAVFLLRLVAALALGPAANLAFGQAPPEAKQLVVAVADGWSADRARLLCYERPHAKAPWRQAVFAQPIPVMLGKGGLAWGRGAFAPPPGHPIPPKRDRDRRAPAGCFAIGKIYGDPPSLPTGSRYPYRQVTRWDAWVDDPRNPYYNQHFIADPDNVPPWFPSQRMRLGDFAYYYLVEIRHNSDPPAPGMGSAIFFHIRRGPNTPSAGCTTMEKANLIRVIQWLRAPSRPHYVLLPKAEYVALQRPWNLPLFPLK